MITPLLRFLQFTAPFSPRKPFGPPNHGGTQPSFVQLRPERSPAQRMSGTKSKGSVVSGLRARFRTRAPLVPSEVEGLATGVAWLRLRGCAAPIVFSLRSLGQRARGRWRAASAWAFQRGQSLGGCSPLQVSLCSLSFHTSLSAVPGRFRCPLGLSSPLSSQQFSPARLPGLQLAAQWALIPSFSPQFRCQPFRASRSSLRSVRAAVVAARSRPFPSFFLLRVAAPPFGGGRVVR